jgi:hypothetical protein
MERRPADPAPNPTDPMQRVQLLLKGDLPRWERIGQEWQRRQDHTGMTPRQAAESVEADVLAGRL